MLNRGLLLAFLLIIVSQFRVEGSIKMGSSGPLAHLGDVDVCVIFVEFADCKFHYDDARYDSYGTADREKLMGYFEDFLNGENYKDKNHFASQREYFIEQSRGKFRPRFDLYGPVDLGITVAEAKEMAIYELGNLASTIADETLDIDFSKYDVKNNGTVNGVVLVIPQGSIGCKTQASFMPPTLDGKRLGSTMLGPEVDDGAFTHEFGHLLGLPDFYNGAGAYTTPEFWDIMDNGCYNGGPISFSSLERWILDWIDAPAATLKAGDKASVVLPTLTERDFFIKVETGRDGEFYLLENRAKTGFDKNLRAEGMLIWHVDAARSDWMKLPNSDVNHMRIDVVRADNEKKRGGGIPSYLGDPFPGSTNNTAFGANTVPQMYRWADDTSADKTPVAGCEISNIQRNADTGEISFDFNGGSATNIIKPGEIDVERFTISVEGTPEEGGTVSVNGVTSVVVDCGSTVKFEAVPSASFNFVNWTRDGYVVSTEPVFSSKILAADQAAVYKANFRSKNAITIKVTSNPLNAGISTVNGQTEYDANPGEKVVLRALPIDGVNFLGWKKGSDSDYVSTENPYIISSSNATDAGSYTACYETNGCILTISCLPEYAGRVEIDGYNSNPVCVPKGTKLTFRAIPEEGYRFSKYTVNNSNYGSSNPYTIQISGDRTFVAHFVAEIPTYQMTVASSEGGTATVNGQDESVTIEQGKTANYVAVAADGYEFVNWTDESGEEMSTDSNWIMWPEYDAKYTANFKKVDEKDFYIVAAICRPSIAGSVTVNGVDNQTEVEKSSKATFLAIPNEGYEFLYWTDAEGGVLSSEARYEIQEITEDIELIAVFESDASEQDWNVRVVCEPMYGGKATVNGAEGIKVNISILSKPTVEFSAIPNDGYEFEGWYYPSGLPTGITETTHSFTLTTVSGYGEGTWIAKFKEDSLAGIENIQQDESDDVIYDLQGRRLRRIVEPGIYIVNGKKVVVTT